MIASLGGVLGLTAYAVMTAIIVSGMVRILANAGYSPWWVLVSLIPLVNLAFFFVFAYSDWPLLKELRNLGERV